MEISLISTTIKWALGGAAMASLLMFFATQRIPVPEKIEVEQPKFNDTWTMAASAAALKSASLRDTAPKPVVTETVLPDVIAKPEELTPKLKRKLVHYNPPVKRDVCSRHGMRKVYRGRGWRCRR
jgi:hypothetical protein